MLSVSVLPSSDMATWAGQQEEEVRAVHSFVPQVLWEPTEARIEPARPRPTWLCYFLSLFLLVLMQITEILRRLGVEERVTAKFREEKVSFPSYLKKGSLCLVLTTFYQKQDLNCGVHCMQAPASEWY